MNSQSGQTLIETILAIFILTTSLVAGLSLAIYALTVSSVTKNQVVATNLAREGIEIIRMMRDSNWLAAEPDPAQPDPDSSDDLQSCPDLGGDFCYPKVYSAPDYNLGEGNYRLIFNSSARQWSLASGGNYNLFLQADGQYTHTSSGNSIYARQVQITHNSNSPYTLENPEMIVQVGVLWRGKNCEEFNGDSDLFLINTPCRILVEEHMTNWKNYK